MSNSVLIVEDDHDIRETLKELLELEGYQATAARDGLEALKLLKTCATLPSLILLDLMMPVMDGEGFLTALKNEAPGLSRIPVIILTAAGNTRTPKASAFVRKPINVDDLLAMIARLKSPQSL